jgi:chromosome segregation ATPase
MSIFPNPSPTSGGQQPVAPPPPPPSAPPPPPAYASTPYYPPPPPPPVESGTGMKIPILFGAVIALLGAVVYLYMQLDHVKKDLTATNTTMQAQLDKLVEASSLTSRTNTRKVEELKDQLERARRQAALAAGAAKDEALRKVDEAKSQLQAAQQQAKQELQADISSAKEAADTKITAVGSEVSNVKTDVAATKTELEKTVADLKRATGDLDGHSVLIATNAKELAALRTLGERNYIDFTVTKSKTSQKVNDIQILLKKADLKKHTFTIELTVDDSTVEKKDKVMNEPVQFMTSKSKQPYELVVNKVTKDTIAGYLAVPKVLNQRN